MKKIHVVAAIIMQNNKILCTQRSDKGSLPLKWEFPGGKIESGETNENALVREIGEELNCEIQVNQLFFTVKHQYPTFHITMHSYLCEMKSSNESIVLNEHHDSKWLDIEDLNGLDWAQADLPIVGKLIEEI